jgi:hypothetical protein
MLEYLKKSDKRARSGREGTITGLKYSQLVELLGEPKKFTEEETNKVDVEWSMEGPREKGFMVWNYKNGPNYLNGRQDEDKIEKAIENGEITKDEYGRIEDLEPVWNGERWVNEEYDKLMEKYGIKMTLEDIQEWSVGFPSDSVFDRSLAKMVFGDKLRVGFPVMSNGGRIVIMSEIH